MNNETFGITFQYAICLNFKIVNDISINRIDKGLFKSFIESKIINKIFRGKPKPIEYLTTSKNLHNHILQGVLIIFCLTMKKLFM